jgi:hypothetical protein
MNLKKSVLFLSFFFSALTLAPQLAQASEGYAELRSTTGTNARCFAFSTYLSDGQFHILTTCREIVYPAGPYLLHYVLWAKPVEGRAKNNAPIRLATVGSGKMSAKTNTPFTSLFVTKEGTPKAKEPSNRIILQGDIRELDLLKVKTVPESKEESEKETQEQEEPKEEATEEQDTEGEDKAEAEAAEEEKEEEEKESWLQKLLQSSALIPLAGFGFVIFLMIFLIRRRG